MLPPSRHDSVGCSNKRSYKSLTVSGAEKKKKRSRRSRAQRWGELSTNHFSARMIASAIDINGFIRDTGNLQSAIPFVHVDLLVPKILTAHFLPITI